jgi:toxin ParE1/3/4
MLTQWPWILLYETIPDANEGEVLRIEVVRVLDGRRDLTSLV